MTITTVQTTWVTDIQLVRQVLMRELETISAYEAFAAQATDPRVRSFMSHLATEEKEHVAEATDLLRRLDSEQDALFQTERSEDHFTGRAPSTPPTQGGAPPPRASPVLTIGSLRHQP